LLVSVLYYEAFADQWLEKQGLLVAILKLRSCIYNYYSKSYITYDVMYTLLLMLMES